MQSTLLTEQQAKIYCPSYSIIGLNKMPNVVRKSIEHFDFFNYSYPLIPNKSKIANSHSLSPCPELLSPEDRQV